jgi:uncharacterized protein YukE
MMTGFKVEPESLRQAARELDDAVDAVDDVLDRFDDRLAGFGEPWGDDDVGFLIGLCYLPGYDTAMACFENNLDELGSYGDRLSAMADAYQDVDDDGLQAMQGLQARLDGGYR